MENISLFESKHIVKYYSGYLNGQLNKPETTILNIIEKHLPEMTMLDIGVGTGRTTYHFAKKVKEYIGIDYAKNMISVCKEQFAKFPPNVFFKVADARNMNELENHYFDFILCSFNGLDFISHEDRINALNEIKRVGKKGGLFCFSSHNLQNNDIFRINILKPLSIIRYIVLSILNKEFYKKQQEKYTFIKGAGHLFRLNSYFIQPEEQIKQLHDIGFENIRVFDLHDGKEIESSSFSTLNDNYLYYLCNM